MKIYRFLYSLSLCLLAVGTTTPQSSLRRRSGQDSRVMRPADQQAYQAQRSAGSEQRRQQMGFNADLMSKQGFKAAFNNPEQWAREFVTIYEMPDWERQYTGAQVNEFIKEISDALVNLNATGKRNNVLTSDDLTSALNNLTVPERLKKALQRMFEPLITRAQQLEIEDDATAGASSAEPEIVEPEVSEITFEAKPDDILSRPLQQVQRVPYNTGIVPEQWLTVEKVEKPQEQTSVITTQHVEPTQQERQNAQLADLKRQREQREETERVNLEQALAASRQTAAEEEQKRAANPPRLISEKEEEAKHEHDADETSDIQPQPVALNLLPAATTPKHDPSNVDWYDRLLSMISKDEGDIRTKQQMAKEFPNSKGEYLNGIAKLEKSIQDTKKIIEETPELKAIAQDRAQAGKTAAL